MSAGDLRTARVYYLVFGKEGPDPKVQRGLESAAGFLRNALSKSLMIRYTPTLTLRTRHHDRAWRALDPVDRLIEKTRRFRAPERPAQDAERDDR